MKIAMKRIIPISFVLFLFLSCIAVAQTENRNTVPGWDNVVKEAQEGGYKLIAPDEIKTEYLKDPGSLFLVDTRQEWAYRMQHIKGALYLPATPSWWYQYYPGSRSEMKKVLGPDKNKKITFY
jgi:hypothetical protein